MERSRRRPRNNRRGYLERAALALLSALFALGTSAFAFADQRAEKRYVLNIPSSKADVALIVLARELGKSLIIPSEDVFKARSRELNGSYTLSEALDTMLEGTNLSGSLTESGAIIVSLRKNEKPVGGDMKRSKLFVTSVLSTALVAPGVARGQVDTIVVTAQKREQSAQEVPISISALDSEGLRNRGVTDIEGIVGQFPNVNSSASNSITTNFSIRGIATNHFQGNVSRSVGIYIDDVTQAHAFTGTYGVFDMERVEILRGPQNTLNGRNTTGGAVNFVTAKPEIGAGANGYGRITYGRFNRVDVEGALGFDLGDNAAFRLAGLAQWRDGAFTNLVPGREGEELGEREKYSGRAQFLWAPGDATEVLASFRFGLNRGKEPGNISNGIIDPSADLSPTGPAATAPDDSVLLPVCASLSFTAYDGSSECVDILGNSGMTSFDGRRLFNAGSGLADVDVFGGTFRIDHDFGGAMLTSITAYDDVSVQLQDDLVGTSALQNIINQDYDQKAFQQELRLVSSDDKPFRWILGGYFYREELAQSIASRQDQNPLNPNPAPTFGVQNTTFNILDQVDRDISVFAQSDFDLTDRLTISGGLRYTNNRKVADSLFGNILVPQTDRMGVGPNAPLGLVQGTPATTFIGRDFIFDQLAFAESVGVLRVFGSGPPPFIADNYSNRDRFGIAPTGGPVRQEINRLSGDATIKYDIADGANVFFRYARGFKSGAFDTRANASLAGSGASVPTGPETVDAYEIGLKSNPAPSLQFNASAFYYDQKDLQIFDTGPLGPQFLNLPGSRVIGVEVDSI